MGNNLLTDQSALINLIVNNNWSAVAVKFRALSFSYIDTEEEVRGAISDMLSEQDYESLSYVLDVPLNVSTLTEQNRVDLANAGINVNEKSFDNIVNSVTGLISTVFGGRGRREASANESAAIQAQAAAQAAAANSKATMTKYLMYAAIAVAVVVAGITVFKIVKS